MTSAIDPTKPESTRALTSNVRANFSAAKTEIEALQAQFANGVDNLTAAEVTQLANINASTISTTQWGFLGAMDQGVSTTDAVQFGATTLASATVTNLAGTGTRNVVVDANGVMSAP